MQSRYKKKRKKAKLRPEDYEGFSFGPLTFERFGRTVVTSLDLKSHNAEAFKKFVKEKRPENREQINKKIQQTISIITNSNPLHILTMLATKNLVTNPETYAESTFQGNETYLEYGLSLVLGIDKFNFNNDAASEDGHKVNELVEEIFHDVVWYFASELADGKRDVVEDEVRFWFITRYLMFRGDSYYPHHLELLKNLFTPHDSFLKNKMGFTICELIDSVAEMKSQISENINAIAKSVKIRKRLMSMFLDFIREDREKLSSKEEALEAFGKLPDVKRSKTLLSNVESNLKEIPFEIAPSSKLDENLLKILSVTFGENESFMTFEKSPAWPTNDSVVQSRPLMCHDGRYYGFGVVVLGRKLKTIIESWISDIDSSYFNNAYQRQRAHFLESAALKYFANILRTAEIYHTLFYSISKKRTNSTI